MPKRSFWREMVLISVPLLFVGGVFGWDEWQKRFRTSTIALSVKLDTPPTASLGPFGSYGFEQLRFGWEANLSGGPKSGYHFGSNERVVAQTRRGPVTVWQLNSPPKSWPLNAASGTFGIPNTLSAEFSSYQGLNRASQSRHYTLERTIIPLDTQSLAWHGEIAAIPADNADPWQSPLSHDTLQSWAQMPGAVHWQKIAILPYDQDSGPVIIRSRKSKGKIEVEILSRQENKRACRRLIAFDGTKQRVLWTDTNGSTGYCNSVGNASTSLLRDIKMFSFKMGVIPPSWGEVVFLCDIVFDINKRAPIVSPYDDALDERALAAFERQTDGYRVSRRLVLRPRSTTRPTLQP